MRTARVLAAAGYFLAAAAPAHAGIRAGAAQAVIELPARVPLAGYSRRGGQPSTGVHDPVHVRALVIEHGRQAAAVISCELLVIDERLADGVRQRLARDGSGDLAVFLAATHTHSGPGAYGRRFLEKISMGHYDPAVWAAILDAVSQAVAQARASLAPVTRAAYGVRDTEGLVANRIDPHGVVARQLTLHALYRDGREAPFVIVGAFAAHPTTLGAGNRMVSADYPGVWAREVERRVPGAVGVFLAGAVADQAPIKQGDEFEPSERLGHALADETAAWLAGAQRSPVRSAWAVIETFRLDAARIHLGRWRLPRWLGRMLVDDDATVSVLRVGEVAYTGAPCDLSAVLGARIEAAVRGQGLQPIVAGFVNDYIGYCVPEDTYATHSYEATMSFNGPRTGERVASRLIELMREAPAP